MDPQIAMFFHMFFRALSLVVVLDVVSSWFVKDPNGFPRSVTGAITGPLYAPFRAVVKPGSLGGLDLAPLVAILTLNLLARGALGLAS